MPMFNHHDPSKLDLSVKFDLGQCDIDPRLQAVRKQLDDFTRTCADAKAAAEEEAIVTAISTSITAGGPIEQTFTVARPGSDEPDQTITLGDLVEMAKSVGGGSSVSIDCTVNREQVLSVGSRVPMYREYISPAVKPQVSVRLSNSSSTPPRLSVPTTGTGLTATFNGPLTVGTTTAGNTYWSNSSGPAVYHNSGVTHTQPAPPAEEPPAPQEAAAEPLTEGPTRRERAVDF